MTCTLQTIHVVSHSRNIDLIKAVDVSNDVYMVTNNRNLDNPELAPSWTTSGLTHPSFVKTGGGVAQRSGWDPQEPSHLCTTIPAISCSFRCMVESACGSSHRRLRHSWMGRAQCMPTSTPNSTTIGRSIRCWSWLEPGDALFPIGWWHHVRALDLSISLAVTHSIHTIATTGTYPERDANRPSFKAFEIDQVGLRR